MQELVLVRNKVAERADIHVLVVAGGGIFVVGGDVDNGTSLDWKVCIANCVSCSDLWALGV